MNPIQLKLVRSSFAGVAAMPEVTGALFYERLFAETPGYQGMFKADMRVQALKIVSMLETIVTNLDKPEEILPTLHELAQRHVGYGVQPADYEPVKRALLWTLELALGDEFDTDVRDAWATCYDGLAEAMKSAPANRSETGAE